MPSSPKVRSMCSTHEEISTNITCRKLRSLLRREAQRRLRPFSLAKNIERIAIHRNKSGFCPTAFLKWHHVSAFPLRSGSCDATYVYDSVSAARACVDRIGRWHGFYRVCLCNSHRLSQLQARVPIKPLLHPRIAMIHARQAMLPCTGAPAHCDLRVTHRLPQSYAPAL